MIKMKKMLNAVMSVCLGYYIGHFIFVLWNHYRQPEIYAMQSAPWYTSLWVYGIVVLAVIGICILIKLILNHIEKTKKP